MDDKPLTETLDDQPGPAYSAINLRARAFLIDTAILGGSIIAFVVISAMVENLPWLDRLLLIGMFALLFLYEPILVATRGATVGHRAANIQVVSDKTGGPPAFAVAFARYIIKAILGILSFLGMAFTRRHQAVHDLLTGTTVQLRDPSLARSFDFVAERKGAPQLEGTPPPLMRRFAVSVSYLVVTFVLSNILGSGLLSRACRVWGECSEIDQSNSLVISAVLILVAIVIIVMGAMGRLPGARRTAKPIVPPV